MPKIQPPPNPLCCSDEPVDVTNACRLVLQHLRLAEEIETDSVASIHVDAASGRSYIHAMVVEALDYAVALMSPEEKAQPLRVAS